MTIVTLDDKPVDIEKIELPEEIVELIMTCLD